MGAVPRCDAGRHLLLIHQDLGEISQPHRLHRLWSTLLPPTLLPLRAFARALALPTATFSTAVTASTRATTSTTSILTARTLTSALAATAFTFAALDAAAVAFATRTSVRHAGGRG